MGQSVQVSGDGMTAVAGAPGRGTVHVFVRDQQASISPSTWTKEASLAIDATATFGRCLSIDGSGIVMAVGGPYLAVDAIQTGMSSDSQRFVCLESMQETAGCGIILALTPRLVCQPIIRQVVWPCSGKMARVRGRALP